MNKLTEDLVKHLKEGLLQEDFVLDSIPKLMALMRDANVTFRWTVLHCASLETGLPLLWRQLIFVLSGADHAFCYK